MAKIKKIQESGTTIYPATITNAVKDPETGKTIPEILKEREEDTYPKMSVGFAENIVGDGSATPEVFSFRPTAGENRNTLNDGAARIQTLKGSSVVVNQIAKVRTNTTTRNGITVTNDGVKSTVVGTAGASETFTNISLATASIAANHKCLLGGCPSNGSASTFYFSDGLGNRDYGQGVIFTTTEAHNNTWMNFTVVQGTTVDFVVYPVLYDLTLMFGAGNEPTTVAEFYQRRPVGLDLAAYNEGEIVDGNYEAIKTTGFNQWDEQWENGYYNKTTGVFKSNANYLCSKNPIKVIGGSIYYILSTFPNQVELCYYDASGNFVGSAIAYNGRKYTIPNGVCSLNFSTYATSYNGQQFCFNLSWDEYTSMNGTYKPYKPFERDLSWVAKYFPNGMRSAGSAHDEIRFNSSTQKWEAVQRVGVRAYASGDENNNAVITDKVNTNYALPTPIVTEITENVNFDFDVSDYGTEELISDGASAPLSADIVYEPNVLATIKNLPNILARLTQMEAMVSAMAVATTNMNE